MENLKTEPVRLHGGDGPEEYVIKEKDYGDQVVYDIYRRDCYLLTMGADGSILFMNFDAPQEYKEVFRLSRLNQFIEKIRTAP